MPRHPYILCSCGSERSFLMVFVSCAARRMYPAMKLPSPSAWVMSCAF